MTGIRTGRGGWTYYHDPSLGAARVYLRFAEEDHRFRVAELCIRFPREGGELRGEVTGSLLRALPLGQLEAHANSPEWAEIIRACIANDAQAVETESSKFWDEMAAWGPLDMPMPTGVAAMFGVIDVPSEAKRSDAFYSEVAAVYSRWAAVVRNPAVRIAAVNNVPVSTVHRWVKEARRRGLLQGGRRSKNRQEGTPS